MSEETFEKVLWMLASVMLIIACCAALGIPIVVFVYAILCVV